MFSFFFESKIDLTSCKRFKITFKFACFGVVQWVSKKRVKKLNLSIYNKAYLYEYTTVGQRAGSNWMTFRNPIGTT